MRNDRDAFSDSLKDSAKDLSIFGFFSWLTFGTLCDFAKRVHLTEEDRRSGWTEEKERERLKAIEEISARYKNR